MNFISNSLFTIFFHEMFYGCGILTFMDGCGIFLMDVAFFNGCGIFSKFRAFHELSVPRKLELCGTFLSHKHITQVPL